jgi:hypothetical protein
MDLPLFLETQTFVEGKKEIEQQFLLILKNDYGDFLSDWELGSAVSPHVSSLIANDIRVRVALKKIPVTINDIMFSRDKIAINYTSSLGQDTYFYENV